MPGRSASQENPHDWLPHHTHAYIRSTAREFRTQEDGALANRVAKLNCPRSANHYSNPVQANSVAHECHVGSSMGRRLYAVLQTSSWFLGLRVVVSGV